MSKKSKERRLQQNASAPVSSAAVEAQPRQEPAAPAQDTAAPEPSMKKYLVVFWSAVALAVAAAWTLEHFMPLTREYTIERIVMLVFGGFLVVFLYFLK